MSATFTTEQANGTHHCHNNCMERQPSLSKTSLHRAVSAEICTALHLLRTQHVLGAINTPAADIPNTAHTNHGDQLDTALTVAAKHNYSSQALATAQSSFSTLASNRTPAVVQPGCLSKPLGVLGQRLTDLGPPRPDHRDCTWRGSHISNVLSQQKCLQISQQSMALPHQL